MIYKTLWTRAGSGFLILMHEKFNWFCLTNNSGTIDVKRDGFVLEEKSSFKMLGFTFSVTWIGPLTLSLLLKLPP